jgi:SRSO17 transposase
VKSQDQQVAAGAIVGDGAWLDRLQGELRGALAPVFAQARSRLTAFAYIGALLAEPGDRKSCWQLAERAGHATPRRMQALLAEHARQWEAALKALQRFILAHLGDRQAVLVVDETAELKQGDKTVGVTRQHAGITGQAENCQTVVFAAYVTGRGHACSTSGCTCRRAGARTGRGGSGRTSRTTRSSAPSPRSAPR